jgi:dihydrofolate reductase
MERHGRETMNRLFRLGFHVRQFMKVTLMMAVTADGLIARNRSHFSDWTCSADKRLFKQLTQKAGVVIFGSRTFDTIGTPLPGRLNVIMTRKPARYHPQKNLMLFSGPPARLLEVLTEKGYGEAILAGGAIMNTLFVKPALVDEVLLTISPKIFGQGITLFSEPLDLALELINVEQLEKSTLVLRYKVQYHPAPSKGSRKNNFTF